MQIECGPTPLFAWFLDALSEMELHLHSDRKKSDEITNELIELS